MATITRDDEAWAWYQDIVKGSPLLRFPRGGCEVAPDYSVGGELRGPEPVPCVYCGEDPEDAHLLVPCGNPECRNEADMGDPNRLCGYCWDSLQDGSASLNTGVYHYYGGRSDDI